MENFQALVASQGTKRKHEGGVGVGWSGAGADWVKLFDGDIPQEILDKCTENECSICSVGLNKGFDRFYHYKGKLHCKKVNQALIEYAERTGEPVPKRIKPSGEVAGSEKTEFTCEPCGLTMSGKSCYDLHVSGKKHQRKVSGCVPGKSQFYCQVCDVSATDNSTFQLHEKGAKHLRKLKEGAGGGGAGVAAGGAAGRAAGGAVDGAVGAVAEEKKKMESPKSFYCDVCVINAPDKAALDAHFNGKAHRKKMFARQTSQHWCPTCKITAVGSKALQEHYNGKAHMKMVKNLEHVNMQGLVGADRQHSQFHQGLGIQGQSMQMHGMQGIGVQAAARWQQQGNNGGLDSWHNQDMRGSNGSHEQDGCSGSDRRQDRGNYRGSERRIDYSGYRGSDNSREYGYSGNDRIRDQCGYSGSYRWDREADKGTSATSRSLAMEIKTRISRKY